MSSQAQKLINWFNYIIINQLFQMAAVNDVIRLFEGNINIGDPTGLKLYLQEMKEIDRESYKLDI